MIVYDTNMYKLCGIYHPFITYFDVHLGTRVLTQLSMDAAMASQENGWSCRFGTQRDRSVFKRSHNSRLLREIFSMENLWWHHFSPDQHPFTCWMWNQDPRNLLQTNLWDRQQFECSRDSPFFGACWKYSCYTWALLNNGCFLGFPPKSRTFRSFPWANQPFQLRILAMAHLLSWPSMKLHDLHCIWMYLVHLEQCILPVSLPVTRYYRSAMGILMVYDVTSEVRSSIPNCFGFCLPFGGQAWQ